MKNIIVSSKNPCKIESTYKAFKDFFPSRNFEVKGYSVPSGVSSQPMGDNETLLGAKNRNLAIKDQFSGDIWVSIEGGCEWHGSDLAVFAWVVIESPNFFSKGKSALFYLPAPISHLVKDGLELGHACDKYFGQTNSKKAQGAIGLLTNGHIDRTDYYVHAIKMALIPFLNETLFEK